jgi:hypothetical protein
MELLKTLMLKEAECSVSLSLEKITSTATANCWKKYWKRWCNGRAVKLFPFPKQDMKAAWMYSYVI